MLGLIKKNLLAVDIGSSSIKLIDFDNVAKRRLTHIGMRVLPKGAVDRGEVKDVEGVKQQLLELIAEQKVPTRGRRVAINIGGSHVMIKKAFIRPENGVDIADQAYEEARQLFGMEMDDLYFRFAEIPSQFVEARSKALLLVGAKRELVEKHIAIIRACGLRIGVIDTDVFCLANSFEHNYEVKPEVVVHISVGAASTVVLITYNGEFMFTREIVIGGNDYTTRIAQAMNVQFSEAETIKITSSLQNQNAPAAAVQVIRQMNDELVREVVSTINYYVQTENAPPSASQTQMVYLSGGASQVIGLDAALASALHVPVQILNPMQHINIGKLKIPMEEIIAQSPFYGVAIGLALRDFGDNEA